MDVEHGLIVSFPDQSEPFTLGVEAGMFWQRIESGEVFTMTAHSANLEVLRRMADARDFDLHAEASGVDGWHNVTVERRFVSLYTRPKLRVIQGGIADTNTSPAIAHGGAGEGEKNG